MAAKKRLWLARGLGLHSATITLQDGRRPELKFNGKISVEREATKFRVEDFEEATGIALQPGEVREVKSIEIVLEK